MTYPEDYGQPSQYPQQAFGQEYRQDPPWQPQQYDPFAHQQRIWSQQEAVDQHSPWNPQPWEQPNPQRQAYGQPWPPQRQPDAPQPPPPQQPAMPPQAPKGRKRKSWPARHKSLTGLIAFGALIVIIVASNASNPSKTDTSAAGNSAASSAALPSVAASSAPATPAAAPVSPSMTGAQQQAVDAAESYLSEGQGFSEQGLLDQLTSNAGNGFAVSDAQFAVNYLHPNWDAQAVDAATGYLSEGQGFSEEGLLQQLTSDAGSGFTEAEAEYAVNYLHPNWDAQAVDAANGYLGDGEGFSRSSLLQQLTSDAGSGFTEAQGEYAVNKVMP